MSEPLITQVAGLASLVELERRVRRTGSLDELRFLAVNETHGLVAYRQAILVEGRRGGRPRVTALSGVAAPDRNAPYVVWATALARRLARNEAGRVSPAALGAAPEAADWPEWLPAHGFWLPLPRSDEAGTAALLIARDSGFSQRDEVLLGYLAESLGEGFVRLTRPPPLARRLVRAMPYKPLLVLVLLALLGALPVRLSALAPGEVEPFEPAIIRSSLDGVVEQVAVVPNQPVKAGEVLVRLDPDRLESRIAVARGAFAMAEAEYRQAATRAVREAEAKSRLAVLQSRLEQRHAEVVYLEGLRERIAVTAPRDGIAIFESVEEWVGRPLKVGERIMVIADPAAVELELRLPVADAIELEPGAAVQFFLNVAPQDPIAGALSFSSYRATPGEDGALAYRLRARFADGVVPPRIGLKGTAKVMGEQVSLAYLLLRRPLAVLRRWVGA